MTSPGRTETPSADQRQRAPLGEADSEPAPIVFVGGTGRSGTHVVARLLGRSSHYLNVSNEVRFHAAPGGFPDLLNGEVSSKRFLRSLRRRWWRNFEPVRHSFRGLYRHLSRAEFDRACGSFQQRWDGGDRDGACRQLFFDLLQPLATEAGKPALIEMSCDTIAAAATLQRLFPEARFLHCVRDGRDAAASRSSQGGRLIYPRDILQGLDWWEQRLREMNAGARTVPSDRIMVVSLDELAEISRKRTLRRVLRFLKLDREPRITAFFHRRISADRANRERWRRGLSERRLGEVDRRYAEALDRIEADNIQGWRALRRVQRERAVR